MTTDVSLTCIDCGDIFPFTVKDQEYFREHNYSTPVRCRSCRAKRRQLRAASEDRGVDAQPAAQQPATAGVRIVCSGCGQDAEVPFQPRTDRPVYCRACYEAHKSKRAT